MLYYWLPHSLHHLLFRCFLHFFSYTPESKRSPDTYYFEVWETFIFGIIYVTPIYFLLGIPISIIIDNLLKRRTKSYLLRVVLYSFSSLIPFLILIFLFSSDFGAHTLSGILLNWLLSLFAGNLFLHILIVLEKFIQKRKKSMKNH